MHIMAGKAVALAEVMTPEFKTYGEAVVRNAHALASTSWSTACALSPAARTII